MTAQYVMTSSNDVYIIVRDIFYTFRPFYIINYVEVHLCFLQ